jgi:hypothetical protein
MILQMLGEEALTSRGDYLQCSVKINLFRGKGRGGKHFGKWEAPLQSLTNQAALLFHSRIRIRSTSREGAEQFML